MISTDVDAILNYVKEKKSCSLEEIAHNLDLDKEMVKDIVFSLEEYGILSYSSGIVTLRAKKLETASDLRSKLLEAKKKMDHLLVLLKEEELEERIIEIQRLRQKILDAERECL